MIARTDRRRCAHCADVIGVYEPLILAGDGEIRETSLAAERDVVLAREHSQLVRSLHSRDRTPAEQTLHLAVWSRQSA